MRWRLVLAQACAISWLCLGCSHFRRVSECRSLAATVNERLSVLEQLSKGKESPETYTSLARGYATLASSVSSLPVAKGSAAAEIREYAEIMRSTSRACFQAAAAMRAGGHLDGPHRDLERLSRREKVTSAKLEAFCLSA